MDFDNIRERATCTLGAYISEVLKTLQSNFRRYLPTSPEDSLRQLRHMLGCYEILLSEIDQELAMLGLELYGLGLCKMFYQMLEAVKWLVSLVAEGTTIPLESTPAPVLKKQHSRNASVPKTAQREEEKNMREQFNQYERNTFLVGGITKALDKLQATAEGDEYLDEELQARRNNRQLVASIEKSNAVAILKQAVVMLENQRKNMINLPKNQEVMCLPKVKQLQEMVSKQLAHKQETHTNGLYILNTLNRKLRELLKLKAGIRHPVLKDFGCQATEPVAVPAKTPSDEQRHVENIKVDLERKRMQKQLEDYRSAVERKDHDLSQLMIERDVHLKQLQELRDELTLKHQSWIDMSYKLHSMVVPSQHTLTLDGSRETLTIDQVEEPQPEPVVAEAPLLFKKNTTKPSKEQKRNLLMKPQTKLEIDREVVRELVVPPYRQKVILAEKSTECFLVCPICLGVAPTAPATTASIACQTPIITQASGHRVKKSIQRTRASMAGENTRESRIAERSSINSVSRQSLHGKQDNIACRTTVNSIFFNRRSTAIGNQALMELTSNSIVRKSQRSELRIVEEPVLQIEQVAFNKLDLDLFRGEEQAINYESISIHSKAVPDFHRTGELTNNSTDKSYKQLEIVGTNPQQEEHNWEKCSPQTKDQLISRMFHFMRKYPATLKKVQVFLRYPFSTVQYGGNPEWLRQVEQEPDITLRELKKLIDRLGRLHVRCRLHNRLFCEHFMKFFRRIGFFVF